jgi:hypothetical protein
MPTQPKKPKQPPTPPEPQTPDPKAAKKAFDALLPRMKGLPREGLARVNIDIRQAVIIALAVSRAVAAPAVKKRFTLLHKDLFDQAHLADLEPIALAASHTVVELAAARAQTVEAKLPIDLVDAATEVKTRMLELCAYMFKRHPKLSREVDDIRAGNGYKDLALDLLRLAKIYEDEHAAVSKDGVNYRSDDMSAARTLSQRITEELGEAQSADEKRWVDLTARAWGLLRDVYGEVQSAGAFIFRHEDPEEMFPSLYAGTGRGSARGDKGKGNPAPEGAEAPASPASPEA